MNRDVIGTVAGIATGGLIYSLIDAPRPVRFLAFAFLVGTIAQRLTVWLLSVTDDFGFSAPTPEPPRDTWPPLVRAADDGKLDTVRELIAQGAAVNAKRDDGFTALHLAALHGHDEILTLRFEASADVNATSAGIGRFSLLPETTAFAARSFCWSTAPRQTA